MGRTLALCVALATGISAPARAAVWCSGVPASVLISPDGGVQSDWGYGPVLICNINADSTPPAPLSPVGYKACQGIYSMLLTAMTTNRQFEALLPNDSTCDGWVNNGNWSGRAIGVYNMLK